MTKKSSCHPGHCLNTLHLISNFQKEFKTKSLTWWTDNLVILVFNHGTGWSFFPYRPTNEVEQVEQNAIVFYLCPYGLTILLGIGNLNVLPLQMAVYSTWSSILGRLFQHCQISQNGSISRFYHKHFFYGLSLKVNLAGDS